MRSASRRLTRAGAVALIVLAAMLGGVRALIGASSPPQQRPAAAISPEVMAQIDALLREKASWSPVQRKIDSQLLLPVKRARNEPIAAGAPVLESALQTESDGRVVIDVRANVTDRLLAAVRALGAEVVSAQPVDRDVQLRVATTQIEAIAALPDVIFVQPKQDVLTQRADATAPSWADRSLVRRKLAASVWNALQGRSGVVTNTGSVTSQGDVTHRADEARAAFPGKDGTGVTIGVLSDSIVGFAASQASGDLPPDCPQSGACLEILGTQGGPGGTGNAEGTAMLEIIHDLAPGAKLIFATGVTGLSTFAQNIRDLRTAGCDIIVDDIGYFVETPFQDGQDPGVISTTNGGVVAQAVKDVVAAGALYFSSAGNAGHVDDGTSGTWEGDFADGGATSAPLSTGGRVHSFGPQTFNVLTSSGAANNLFWSDPLGGSSNDYDLFRLNSTGTVVLAASINVQNGTQDPYEQVSSGSANDLLMIVKYSGAPRFLHLGTIRGRLSIATAGEIHGHSATSALNSFGVAATAAASPGPSPNPFNPSNVVELFSSDGPRRIFFNSAGTPLTGSVLATGGQVLNKPDFAAADRVAVTGNGGFPLLFIGTSAAAPHAAAIAALIKSRNLAQTPDQIRAVLMSSVIDIQTPGVDRNSGAGIIMALTTAPTGSTAPTIRTQPLSQEIPAGTAALLRVVATGTVPLTFQWYQGSSGDTSTPIGGATLPQFTTASLVSSASFWVRVSNGSGSVDSLTATISIATSATPVIAIQPPSIGVLSGQSASIGVAALGIGLTYQWYQGSSGNTSTPIGGATSAGFTTPPLTVATNYWVRVTNAAGSADSATATISIGTGPTITVQPGSTAIGCGQPLTLSVTASGTAPLAFQWFAGISGDRSVPITGATSSTFTSPALGATAMFWVRVSNPYDAASSTTATITINPSPNCVHATFDATLMAPRCPVPGSVCDSGSLLVGRDNIEGGPEPNQPNTILNSCADGQEGSFHIDESIDGMRVLTLDGSPIAPGKTIRIETTVWAFDDPDFDFLDLYSAADATNPSWTYLTTLTPLAPGLQTLSATFTLPPGRLQAVRAAFRFGGSPSPCTLGTQTFDDRDDLIFAAGDMIRNGDFGSGITSWNLFEIPDIVHNNAAGGEFKYHKADPTVTPSGQAVIFQQTGLSIPAATPLAASFAIGNEDSVRKRISVLIIDSNFTDLSVCTFWLAPGAPLRTYRMKTHPSKDWANAAIYFYAASNGLGNYRLDDVSLTFDPAGSSTRTECIEPVGVRPNPPGGASGPNLLSNGDFSAGGSPPWAPWGPFNDLVWQVSGGVFEFYRPGTPGALAGGVLQATGQTMTQGEIMTATFQLGNSSSVRKRVTVLLHDLDFTDLSACTYWLAPGLPLSNFAIRSYATKAWTNATLSVYAATTGSEQWIRLDNASFNRTPGASQFLGTECFEPGSVPTAPGIDEGANQSPALSLGRGSNGWTNSGGFVSTANGVSGSSGTWMAEASTSGRSLLTWAQPIDLRNTTSAHLQFSSLLASRASSGHVQVSLDGETWETIATVPSATDWTSIDLDLAAFAGQRIFVRFVFDGIGPAAGVTPDAWWIDDVTIVRAGS